MWKKVVTDLFVHLTAPSLSFNHLQIFFAKIVHNIFVFLALLVSDPFAFKFFVSRSELTNLLKLPREARDL